MATQAWQTRTVQPGGGIPQLPLGGPQSHWGAPGTSSSQAQGPPRQPYGPPPGPPPNYGQSPGSALPYRGPSQANSGGGPLPPPPPLPPGSSSGMVQAGPYAPPSSMQPLQSYGPSMSSFPASRWQPPVPGSTSAPLPQPVTGRVTSEGAHLGSTRPPPPPGPPPPGASQAAGPPAVSAAPVQPPPYQLYPSGPIPGPQSLGPWMLAPQQGSQMQQRPAFSNFPSNFQVSYAAHLHPPQDMAGTGPPGGPYGPGRDPSLPKGMVNPQAGGWGNQPPFGIPPSYSHPPRDVSLEPNGRLAVSDLTQPKPGVTGAGDDNGSSRTTASSLKGEATEVPDAWTAHKTADGAVYYYNSIKGQSTYEKPPGFKGQAEKVTSQPTPVSWERLNGTDWALVTTNDGKKYYYNTKSQATSWQVPLEVLEHRKTQAGESLAKATPDVAAPGTLAEKSTISFSFNVPAAATGGREAAGHKVIVTNTALDLIKRKLQDSGTPTSSSPAPPGVSPTGNPGLITDAISNKLESAKEKFRGNTIDAISSESSSESDEEDPGPSKEERIGQFKEMLKEKGIAPFSKWEKELPKIIFDLRFKAIPSHTERRAIFEHYVRTRADEERKEKRAAQKAAVEGFKQLLDGATKDISFHTTYEHFARTWGEDSRFEALDRKDREALLTERVLPLRKAEEERVRSEHEAAVGGFRAMLAEKTDINIATRWSKVREGFRSDPRYIIVKREEREGLFNAYITELVSAEQEVERAAKAKRDEEEKLKEREREMRKRKEREELEMERVRMKARRKDAVTAYQALLTEKIKDPEASWTEARPKLEKDPVGRATNPELEPADRERFFREHINELFERCVREYRGLLADVITVEAATKNGEEGKLILTSWSEAKILLKPDPRYTKMPRRDRESWWRRLDTLKKKYKLEKSKVATSRAGTKWVFFEKLDELIGTSRKHKKSAKTQKRKRDRVKDVNGEPKTFNNASTNTKFSQMNHYRKGETAVGPKLVKTDLDTLRETYRFIRTEEDDMEQTWEQRLGKRYYDKLFKEYCIADMSCYKESKIGLRWRSEKEVIGGKGFLRCACQFICGNRNCNERDGLRNYEARSHGNSVAVNFAYTESGESKQALVKLRVCPRCAYKLNYRKEKELARQLRKAQGKKRKRRRDRDRDSKSRRRDKKSQESDVDTESESDSLRSSCSPDSEASDAKQQIEQTGVSPGPGDRPTGVNSAETSRFFTIGR